MAQGVSLTLAPAAISSGGTALVPLSFSPSAGASVAALQWTLTWDPAAISSVAFSGGSAATAAGKNLTCNSGSGAVTCVLAGINGHVLEGGIIASATVRMAAAAANTTPKLTGIAVSLASSSIPVSATAGQIMVSVSPVTLTGLTCSSPVVRSGTASCQVTMSAAAGAGGAAILLRSDNAGVSVPASVTVPAGSVTAAFSAQVKASASGTAVISATYGAVTRTSQVAVTSGVQLKQISCNATVLTPGAFTTCTVALSSALAASTDVALSSENPAVAVPAVVAVAAGQNMAAFRVNVGSAAAAGTTSVTATASGKTVSVALTIENLKVATLTCTPNPVVSGAVMACTATLSAAPVAQTSLPVVSSSAAVSVPASVISAVGQTKVAFSARAGTVTASATATITAGSAATKATTVVTVTPVAKASANSSARIADALAAPVIIAALNEASLSSEMVCSAGSSALLTGSGFLSPDGEQPQLRINGHDIQVLSASDTRLVFACPDVVAGTLLDVAVVRSEMVSNVVQITTSDVAPGIYTLSGSGDGAGVITVSDTNRLAVPASVHATGAPAIAGEAISLLTTGVGQVTPVVLIDGLPVEVLSVRPVQGGGVQEVQVRLPERSTPSDAVRVRIMAPALNGHMMAGNEVEMAIRLPQ